VEILLLLLGGVAIYLLASSSTADKGQISKGSGGATNTGTGTGTGTGLGSRLGDLGPITTGHGGSTSSTSSAPSAPIWHFSKMPMSGGLSSAISSFNPSVGPSGKGTILPPTLDITPRMISQWPGLVSVAKLAWAQYPAAYDLAANLHWFFDENGDPHLILNEGATVPNADDVLNFANQLQAEADASSGLGPSWEVAAKEVYFIHSLIVSGSIENYTFSEPHPLFPADSA